MKNEFYVQVTFTDDKTFSYLTDDYFKKVKDLKKLFNSEFIKKIVIINIDNVA